MKNALSYFYNIYIDNIQKINNDYYFSYLDQNFIITYYDRSLDEILELYELNVEMIINGFDIHEIIPTKDNNVIFNFAENYYVLMRLSKAKNRIITYEDIINFNFIPSNKLFYKIDKSNWTLNWENKIDFFEYQFSQVQNKYPIINNSINYYIGMWENAISYFSDNITQTNIIKQVCHKRVSCNMDLFTFINPLNFVIDYKIRDISEYLKSFVLNENFTIIKVNKMLDKTIFNKEQVILLISRTLFPSTYFDLYEKVVVDNLDENILLEVIKKHQNYKILLKIIFEQYHKFNIPLIDWIIKEE